MIVRLYTALTLALTGLVLAGCSVAPNHQALEAGQAADKSSMAYAETTLPVLLTGWQAQNLLKQASPELLAKASPEKIRAYYQTLATEFGPLKAIRPLKGHADVASSAKGPIITAQYKTDAAFAKQDGLITLRLIQHGGQWQVLFLSVQAFSP